MAMGPWNRRWTLARFTGGGRGLGADVLLFSCNRASPMDDPRCRG